MSGVLSLVASQSLAAEQLAPGRNLPSCRWVVDAHVHADRADVGAVMGQPVVGVLGSFGLLQLHVSCFQLNQTFRLVGSEEIVAEVF